MEEFHPVEEASGKEPLQNQKSNCACQTVLKLRHGTVFAGSETKPI